MTRRGILAFVTSGALAPFMSLVNQLSRDDLRGMPSSQLVRDEINARTIGEIYIKELRPEVSSDALRQSILAELGTYLPQRWHDVNAVRADLRAEIRRDFARGDCIILDGWILSKTEVHICALTTLT